MSDPLLERLWSTVLARWENPAAHELFLDHCAQKGLLAEAAARYKEVAAQHDVSPHMQAIQARALTQLSQGAREARPRRRPYALAALVACLAVAGLNLVVQIHPVLSLAAALFLTAALALSVPAR